MSSKLNLRLSRRSVILLVPVSVLVFFGLLHYARYGPPTVLNGQVSHSDSSAKGGGTGAGHSAVVEYADSKAQLNGIGYILEHENVHFKYVGPKVVKEGEEGRTSADAYKENIDMYNEEMKREAVEPKDFDMYTIRPPTVDRVHEYQRANATIFSLVRNEEYEGLAFTISKFEEKFNSKFRYPYMFVNDVPFTDEFKEKVRKLSKAEMEFVVIPPSHWEKPGWVDADRQRQEGEKLAGNYIPYAEMESYHNMCRFYSGRFYNLPELAKFKYYWRIEPDVIFYTDIKYDVFKYLAGTGKKYGFTVNIYEIEQTVETLWPETLDFLNQGDNYKYVNRNGAFQWLTYNEQLPEKPAFANGYSCCHFWSNFEIADLDFYRGEAYTKWFQHLDRTGKFYYERWGDAPVHSIGVGLFLDAQREVHWFKDIGYNHDPYFNCPRSPLISGCDIGLFSPYEDLQDQNCMAPWLRQVKNSHRSVW